VRERCCPRVEESSAGHGGDGQNFCGDEMR
jgi:hypothetical protein